MYVYVCVCVSSFQCVWNVCACVSPWCCCVCVHVYISPRALASTVAPHLPHEVGLANLSSHTGWGGSFKINIHLPANWKEELLDGIKDQRLQELCTPAYRLLLTSYPITALRLTAKHHSDANDAEHSHPNGPPPCSSPSNPNGMSFIFPSFLPSDHLCVTSVAHLLTQWAWNESLIPLVLLDFHYLMF